MKKLFQVTWYPFLFGLYPVLALLSNNIGQVDFSAAYRPALIVLIITLIVFFVFRLAYRDWGKAGVAATSMIILFFTYGHLYNLLENVQVAGVTVGRHRLLGSVWILLAGLSFWWIWKTSAVAAWVKSALNTVALLLVIFPLVHLTTFALSNVEQTTEAIIPGNEHPPGEVSEYGVQAFPGQHLPDVYYIILDGYGRSDTLLADFDYDNTAFLHSLEEKGFYVAECSQSNYSKTDLSLASSLNLDYLIGDEFVPENTDRAPLWRRIKHNTVRNIFDDLGYTTIAFETGYDFTQLTDSDRYYSAPRTGITDFEDLLLKTSAAMILDELDLVDQYRPSLYKNKRDSILFQLDLLEQIPSMPGPKFVFAHLVIPHQPFVFGPDGEFLAVTERIYKDATFYTKNDYIRGYRNQAIFISKRIVQVVDTILQTSLEPPIIIIQGDHGPSHISEDERMMILNAYFLPGVEPELYGSITPVNTFRVVFSEYFGANLPLLEDVSYYSEYPYAYQFDLIQNTCLPSK